MITVPAPQADLLITIVDSADPVIQGDNVTYTATVTNNGPDAATGVDLAATLPADTTLVLATPSQGTCDAVVSCALGTIASLGTATVTIEVSADAAIAAVYVSLDLLETSKAKDRLLIASLVDQWFMDQLTNNLVFVARPGQDGQFVELADGSFNPPPGVADALTVDIDGSYILTTVDGVVVDFDLSGNLTSLTDPNGNATTLGYGAGGELATIANNFGRTLTLTYTAGRISQVSDGTGRSVAYGYDAAGNLTGFTNAESDVTTFEYDIDGRMTQIFYP